MKNAELFRNGQSKPDVLKESKVKVKGSNLLLTLKDIQLE